ncbi:MAG: alpha/beta fold hydrolase [Thermodesulfobacteriota bacterium]|nr:alpha/beta fold hydrolase [Thermodesulfobacteriota bacterium]
MSARFEKFKILYPFESHFLDINGYKYHYLDEGEGDPVVMLHGNPTWSFYYRNIIVGLRKKNRVIVPDHMGCGLSDKPQNYNYTLLQHINNTEILIDRLKLQKVTLVLHDWGGAIGMGYAIRNPENIRRFIIFNTAAFFSSSSTIPWRIYFCRLPIIGDIVVRFFNAFAVLALYMACNHRDRITKQVRTGYLAPYNSYANRIAILKFVRDIPLNPTDSSFTLMESIEKGLWKFKRHPMIILWGEKDFCFKLPFLELWKGFFPHAEVKIIKDAAHYVVEDAHERIVPWIKEFLEKT